MLCAYALVLLFVGVGTTVVGETLRLGVMIYDGSVWVELLRPGDSVDIPSTMCSDSSNWFLRPLNNAMFSFLFLEHRLISWDSAPRCRIFSRTLFPAGTFRRSERADNRGGLIHSRYHANDRYPRLRAPTRFQASVLSSLSYICFLTSSFFVHLIHVNPFKCEYLNDEAYSVAPVSIMSVVMS